MPRAHVQVILADSAIPPSLREAVRQTGASTSFCQLSAALRGGLSPAADAIVIIVPDDIRALTRPLRVLFDRMADQPRAALLLRAGGGPVPKLAHPPTLPVTFGCGLDAGELGIRLATMLEMRGSLDSLHRDMVAKRRSEESATRRYKSQLRLASQVQREFLPEALPAFGPVSFSTLFRPADYVSGDIYDVHRLDEEHVAIALADATGHGVPAALLTVFIKRALRGKEIHDGRYRILRPDEVMRQLNEDLLFANLSACPFVAATYAVLNTRTLELALARAGSPYPILRRKNRTLQLLRPEGGLVGISPDAHFAVQTIQLEPGDSLIVCSDGVERIVLPQLPAHAMAEAFRRAAEGIRERNSLESQRAAAAPALAADKTDSRRATPLAAAVGPSASAAGGPANAAAAVAEPRESLTTRGQPAEQLADNANRRTGRPTESGLRRDWSPAAGGLGEVDSASGRPPTSPDEALLASAWCETVRQRGPQVALDQLIIRYETLRRLGYPLDDLTVVAMQVES